MKTLDEVTVEKKAAANVAAVFVPDDIGRNGHRKHNTRIEAEAGGAARLAMSEYNSDAIDKVTDARAK